MNKLLQLLILASENDVVKPTEWWIWITVLLVVLMLPWVALVIYLCNIKYRVRVFSNDVLVETYYFKANDSLEMIVLPERDGYEVEGLYRDPEFILPLEDVKMPKKNLKVYIKWQKNA